MTLPRHTDSTVRRTLVRKALLAGGIVTVLASSAAFASPAGQPGSSREPAAFVYRSTCAITKASDDGRTLVRRAREDKAARSLCRLAAAVELSIRDNPGIF